MFLNRLFKTRPTTTAGKALYAAAVAQARTPAFYAALGVRDTTEGRFELYTLHVVLIVLRLKGEGEAAAETNQALFDAYIESLDIALREMGVGDLSVGKKMKKLGQAFYGRVKSLEDALSVAPAMDDLIARTVLEGADASPAPIARYTEKASAHLATQPLDAILAGTVLWPEVSV